MYFKAIVVELKDNYSIVMKDDFTMVRIKNRDGLKEGDVIVFLEDDIYEMENTKKTTNTIIGSFIAIASIIMILIIPTMYKNSDNVYAVVTIDINPSIQIDVNKSKRIVKVTALNEDGKNLDLDKVTGMEIEEGLRNIKIILEKQNYKIKDGFALIGVALLNDDTEYEKELENIIKTSFEQTNIIFLSSNKIDLEKANKQGISLGRYLAKLKMSGYTGIDIENLSVEKIVNMLKDEKKEKVEAKKVKNDFANDKKDSEKYYQNESQIENLRENNNTQEDKKDGNQENHNNENDQEEDKEDGNQENHNNGNDQEEDKEDGNQENHNNGNDQEEDKEDEINSNHNHNHNHNHSHNHDFIYDFLPKLESGNY
ncbi:MAG: anti-sigma-I factor RsgI family protein [Paraclostridium sp.]|uniref:anti-sigma factor domain-containing protein n=1 Tax=Paraclostridium sp. TaxID=2023273 RepID=UPI003F36E31D